MPVNINGHFYKAKNVEGKMAIGKKYRIKIGDCKKYKNNKFCKGLSSYRSVSSDTRARMYRAVTFVIVTNLP